uniref:Mini-chromosome maintenance complex-binding protein n=1 Tax=Brugia malayi TaxID=6279 RepID=A0A1I9GDE4_BRUMA|nr:Bm10459 [Brugia malayi]
MENDSNQNVAHPLDSPTHSQNIANVKTQNRNSTLQCSAERESRKSDEDSIYDDVDNIFFENVAEYTNDPLKLIKKLKEKYRNEFKDWKCLHTSHAEHGDLVRMRGMILNGVQTLFALNSVITEEEDGSTRTVCGILRSHINCSNIKETKGMTRRNAYILVPERGVTDWYLDTFNGKNNQTSCEAFLKNNESRTYALFYDEESEDFKPNVVFDLYGILDLTEITNEDDDDTKSSVSMMSLHVIHYKPVEYHDIVSLAHLEVLKYKNMQGFESLIYAFEQLFGSKVIAQSLVCHLFISRYSQPSGSMEYTFPYTMKRVFNSKLLIEMIKLFMPKVHVIEVMEKTMEKSWASYERPQSGFEQGLLQVSDNTLIIIDETNLSAGNFLFTKKGRENCHLIKKFLSTRKIPFIYPYQTVEIESNANVIVLSGEKCFLGQEEFAMIMPKSYLKDVDFVRKFAATHENELHICRHALLSCSKNFCDVSICKIVEEMAVESFLSMQRMCRNADDNSARLHRQLILSKLLTSLNGEKIVAEDYWAKAVELENELRITNGSPFR